MIMSFLIVLLVSPTALSLETEYAAVKDTDTLAVASAMAIFAITVLLFLVSFLRKSINPLVWVYISGL